MVKHYRTQEVLKVFRVSHAVEQANISPIEWPRVLDRQRMEIEAIKAGKLDLVDRKSWSWPFLPASVQRMSIPIMKALPYNLRRMSRTPVPRRAINLVKGAIIQQHWDVVPIEDAIVKDPDEQAERIKIAKKIFEHPNNDDSFQTFVEQGLEDFCVVGAMVDELRITPDPKRPIKMWPVNGESIRLFAAWSESTADEMPRYAQMTGLKGERGAILFYNDEMMYIKDNPSTDTPFGISKMEIAFRAVNDFLGVQDMAGRAGSDQIHKTWLWWEQPQSESAYQIVRRHIQNELEGQAKVSIIGGMKKPEVIDINPVVEADLLLNWQELLIRMIANAFDLSAMALGIEHDVNRAIGQVLDDKDFRSAIVPVAIRLQEAFTRKILHTKLGWSDLRFVFLNLDDPDIETKTDMYSKMYSANALTPQEWRKGIGMKPLTSPFAELTQFECMLINAEAMAKVQDISQEKTMQRQQQMQDHQQQQQQNQQQQQQNQQQQIQDGQSPATDEGRNFPSGPGQGPVPGPQGPSKGPSGQFGKGAKMTAPQKLSLPKFPIAGAASDLDKDGTPKYTAKKIAFFPVNRVSELIAQGKLPAPGALLHNMTQQEPSILEEMNDELRSYFEEELDKELNEKKSKRLSPRYLKQWAADLGKKYKKDSQRTSDMVEWLRQQRPSTVPGVATKSQQNRPGLPRKSGKPGNMNPTQSGNL